MRKKTINKVILQSILYFTFLTNLNLFFPVTNAENYILENNEPILLNSNVIDHYLYEKIAKGNIADLKMTTFNSAPIGNESVILKLKELVIMQSSSQGVVLEDGLGNFSLSHTTPTNPYIPNIQSISTGQFDLDSQEEIIVVGIVGNEGRVVIYDDAVNSYVEKARYAFPISRCLGDCSLEIVESAVVAGNFNGNGTDEFAVVFTEYDWDDLCWVCPPDNFDSQIHFYIFDPLSNTQLYHEYLVPADDAAEIADGGRSDHIALPRIVAGEIDGDGREEIVFTTTGPAVYRGWVYEFSVLDQNYTRSHFWNSDLDSYYPVNYLFDRWHSGYPEDNNLALGDVDGDGLEEILYSILTNPHILESSILILDDKINSFRELDVIDITGRSGKNVKGGLFQSGDVDGDGLDELAVFSLYPGKNFGLIFDDKLTNYTIIKTWEHSELASIIGKELLLKDLDIDGMDEIIFSTGNNIPTKIFNIENIFIPISTILGSGTNILDDAKNGYTILYTNPTDKGFIASGDFDADGVTLKYTGEHWTTTTPPKVIMIIAAPPTYRGISHNYPGSYTAFGSETSKGITEGNTMTISEGSHWSVGEKIGASFFDIFSLEASISFGKSITNELARTKTKTRTETVVNGYLVGVDDDAVIYQTTTFDNYKYEIISHPAKPDLIGEFITIDVPQVSSPWKVSREYFNFKFSSISPAIGSETFNHTVGKPWTYPNISEIESIASIRWTATQKQTVGLGDGVQTSKIDLETETGSQMSRTYTTETTLDAGGTLGLITMSGGWHSAKADTQFSEVTIGNSMSYEGAVGDILDNTSWEELKFSFGLFVYNLERADGFGYQVINYYVENATIREDPMNDAIDFITDIVNMLTWSPEYIVLTLGVLAIPSGFILRRRLRKGKRKK